MTEMFYVRRQTAITQCYHLCTYSIAVLFLVNRYKLWARSLKPISFATRKFTLIMYADDTTLVSHLENFGATNSAIEDGLNQEISKVNTWLLSNKLVLNVAKSKFMLFFKHPKILPTLNLSINDNPIEQVTNFNFLGPGSQIDQNITWNDHISKISIKVARVIGILNKLKHIFPHGIMRTIITL